MRGAGGSASQPTSLRSQMWWCVSITGPLYVIRPSSMLEFVHDFDHYIHERLKIFRRNRERRREINDIADRPDKNAQLNESRTHCVEIADPLQLYDSNCTFYANVLYAFQNAAWRQ